MKTPPNFKKYAEYGLSPSECLNEYFTVIKDEIKQVSVWVVVNELMYNIDLDKYMENYRENFGMKDDTDSTFEECYLNETRLDGEPAYEVIIRYRVGRLIFTGKRIVSIKDNMVYLVLYHASSDKYLRDYNIMNKIISSFKFNQNNGQLQ